ncbi:pantoate--beta-alanine ligase [Nostoc ellipsosporum NOK]|nr:pantoate--beta-alanine ligase [Nostoc ellipsosporum NOK]
MIIFKTASELRAWCRAIAEKGLTTGFVPTMGALHEGHLSLLAAASAGNPVTIVSIFVNPTQFNDPADYAKYPNTLDKDVDLLEKAGCTALFLPSVEEMYPEGLPPSSPHYELGFLETVLDGAYRPGHFQGVCMVVHRLLKMVAPDHLYMGQKDYQQCLVIGRLLEITGMNTSITLHICPTQRESDGLAMSSRNLRLSAQERRQATAIYRELTAIREQLRPGELISLKQKATEHLEAQGFRPDYIEIADATTLELISDWDGKRPLVALAAAFLGEVRLIDNMLIAKIQK